MNARAAARLLTAAVVAALAMPSAAARQSAAVPPPDRVEGATPDVSRSIDGTDRRLHEVWVEPLTGMRFVELPPGAFRMGTPVAEPDREAQEIPHRVTLTHGFWIGQYEVTQAQWQEVMGTTPASRKGADLPIENVNLLEVRDFLNRLSERSVGRFRLPTEAEWEYACRAGTETAFNSGAKLTPALANIASTPETAAGGRTMPVGSFAPNAWGIYDMHGNVWEWTAGEHCPYAAGAVIDPAPACGAPLTVIRGGSWRFLADSARCGLRYTHRPQDRGPSLGFRVVLDRVADGDAGGDGRGDR
jgi:formylglycine-generating enzyme required for sulfatase activity